MSQVNINFNINVNCGSVTNASTVNSTEGLSLKELRKEIEQAEERLELTNKKLNSSMNYILGDIAD